jgi:hypothetical protein
VSGWTVPGYTEIKVLGVGGFGAVVLARHDATGTPVAIKFLRQNLLADQGFATMFRAEAVTLGAVDSPYVVRLYEYVEASAGAAIVMELVDGVSLQEIVTRQGKTTPEAALLVLYGSLLGLAAAHAEGVVHRDFKPANVLVNAYGASKLTDFGISARTGSATVPAGSLSYAPPEQFDGGPATPASDVYAATATFYECLTGHPPFRGDTADELIAEHRSASVPLELVPAALQPIVAAGMAKDPGQRQVNAATLAAELRTVAAGTYGADWADRGRSHLGGAAVLLAALWPTGGAASVHGFTAEQVQLSRGAHIAQHAQAAHHPATSTGLHRWHLRHVLHRDRLAHLRATRTARGARTASRASGHLRTATVAVTAAAVIAAGLTVAATSRPPAGPGTAAQSAATYRVAPASAVPAVPAGTAPLYVQGETDLAGRAQFVLYGSPFVSQADVDGGVASAAPGEVARLYAQPFPYTSPSVPVQTITLKPISGGYGYDFKASPTVATRYRVVLLRSATATTPLAASATQTLYVVDYYKYQQIGGYYACTSPVYPNTCSVRYDITAYSPPADLQAAMAAPRHAYVGQALVSTSQPPLRLDPAASISAPRRIADNAYEVTVTLTLAGTRVVELRDFGLCTVATAASNGLGLPADATCGQESIAWGDMSVWGSPLPPIA